MKDTFNPKPDEILFVPVGGSGEIGSNLNLYGCSGKWLMVDCGVSFGEETTPGIDITMADPEFIEERQRDLVGLVVTHGHEDHIGAIEYLWDRLRCPVYATPFTAALLRAKLDENGGRGVRIIERQPGERWTLGPFTLEFVHVTHSIPDSAMLVVDTPVGRVLHTGDWKFDPAPVLGEPSDTQRLRELGEEGVLAVVGDSTNALVPGRSGSEETARQGLLEVVRQQKKRVAITCFASNVARLYGAAEAAHKTGREIAFVGRSLWRVLDAAIDSGYWDLPEPLDDEQGGYLPESRALYVVTGSQGENRSALARIAQNEHPEIVLTEGDTVIFSSREIPGNEKEIARVQNQLTQLGVTIITVDDAPVHVSGHPAQDELTELYTLTRPQILIPVHGEPRHQAAHVALAEQCQVHQHCIPLNGHVIRITREGAQRIGELDVGRLGVDGKRLVPLRAQALKAREKMSALGAAVVTLVLDKKSSKLVAAPSVTLLGLYDETIDDTFTDDLAALVAEEVGGMRGKERDDNALLEAGIQSFVRRYINSTLGKKPVTRVQIVRV